MIRVNQLTSIPFNPKICGPICSQMGCVRGVANDCRKSPTGRTTDKQQPVRVSLSTEQWKGLFKRYDTDGDGRLSKQELKSAFNSCGSRCPAWRTWRALSHADLNGDGYISEEEFDDLVLYLVRHGYARK